MGKETGVVKESQSPIISVDENDQSILTGTRVRVFDFVRYSRNVVDAESYFEDDYPQFSLEQFHAAMNYYIENKSKVDEEIRKEKQALERASSRSS